MGRRPRTRMGARKEDMRAPVPRCGVREVQGPLSHAVPGEGTIQVVPELGFLKTSVGAFPRTWRQLGLGQHHGSYSGPSVSDT